jgi:nucleoside-triphosphatase THEP1
LTPRRRLIIIDGMPGSGKTTCANMLSDRLTARGIPNRCIPELEENHPLIFYGLNFQDYLGSEAEQDELIRLIRDRYRAFVRERLEAAEAVTIIESVMLQDTINILHHMGMDVGKLRDLASGLARILEPLRPVLIYYYHLDTEAHWRFICGVRGNEWGPVSLRTDEEFRQAGELWGGSQSFVRSFVDAWDIPKLVIENRDYRWDEYTRRIMPFIDEHTSA